ncbi:hypothetical protein [Mangrovicella endophytica]|uniref:hypothetical protein n=1 Tax=Mangrovicella endophytica TaxID=2066697 RepID=UPI000C9DCE1D|nr:hypothetical protein [Mangrovicella endophytica]
MRGGEAFPEGFGFDPSMMCASPPARREAVRQAARQEPEGDPASAAAGQRSSFSAGPADYGIRAFIPKRSAVRLSRRGFHLDPMPDAEAADPAVPEPQSMIIPTALVGIALAVFGYFLDFS